MLVAARKGIQRSDRGRERLEGAGEHGRDHLQQRHPFQQLPRRLSVAMGQVAGMQPVPKLILQQAAGDERLGPERSRRPAILGEGWARATEVSR